MRFTINKNFSISFSKEPLEIDNARIYIVGSPLGTYYRNKIYNKEDFISYLKANLPKKDLFSIMRKAVGSFYLIIFNSDNITIICSPSSNGLFYYQDNESIILSDDETQIYGLANIKDLDEMEILNLVISHHGLRSPFKTIFTNIKRIIGGQILCVNKEFKISTQLYLKKSKQTLRQKSLKDDEENYSCFIGNMENTARLLSKGFEERDMYLLLSGGIDSSCLLLSFMKYNTSIVPIHWPQSDIEYSMAKTICKKLNVDLLCLPYERKDISFKEKKENILKLYERGLNLISYWHSGNMNLKKYIKTNKSKNPIIISGQNMDSLYAIDTFSPSFAPGFNLQGLSFYIENLLSSQFRFKYTDIFFRIMTKENNYFFIKLLKKILNFSMFGFILFNNIKKKKSINKGLNSKIFDFSITWDNYNYFSSIVAPVNEHTVPLQNFNGFPNELESIREEYFNFKISNILNPFIKEFLDTADIKQIENISNEQMNHMIRLLKRIRFVQGAYLLYYYFDKYADTNRILPVSEGPMSNFLSSYQLSWRDLFWVKRFLYRYFKENLGFSYYTLKRNTTKKYKNKSIKKDSLSKLKEIADFDKILKDIISDRDSIIINSCKNKVIKNYLQIIYNKILYDDFTKLNKSEIMEIERFANAEILLRKIGS